MLKYLCLIIYIYYCYCYYYNYYESQSELAYCGISSLCMVKIHFNNK